MVAVALANGLNANLLRTWVKAHREEQEYLSFAPSVFSWPLNLLMAELRQLHNSHLA